MHVLLLGVALESDLVDTELKILLDLVGRGVDRVHALSTLAYFRANILGRVFCGDENATEGCSFFFVFVFFVLVLVSMRGLKMPMSHTTTGAER